MTKLFCPFLRTVAAQSCAPIMLKFSKPPKVWPGTFPKVKMNTCIYSGAKFDIASGEHILQNSLGARWTSSVISCNRVQEHFGRTIDAELEKGLRQIRSLLGVRGGRGEDGPVLKHLKGESGTAYHVFPGGRPMIAEPVIKVLSDEDGQYEVEVGLGDKRQLDWAVAKLKEKYPNAQFNKAGLEKQLSAVQTYMPEPINFRWSFGGDEFFRGALKAAFNLLGAKRADIALTPVFDSVREFILTGQGSAQQYVRWLSTAEVFRLPSIGEFDHFVAVYSWQDAAYGFVQFYGEVGFLMRLGDWVGGEVFCHGYLVDPLRESAPAEIRDPDFDPAVIPLFDSGALLPDVETRNVYQKRIGRLLSRQTARAEKMRISDIVHEVIPEGTETMTTALLDELTGKLREFLIFRMSSWRASGPDS